ncbi:hypothetical protein JNUCC1_02765 [Lentibacillus sp. JNUCC-1]|uniref:CotD family spore coat protein n=1 Tax=Lentibacillus sp. JNUCC-1 TaxID=2654513 RepID=UPI0012E71B1E|nr:CotD family spore coat protein [Lentibacillus sp. JNUCC-1]MUV38893.1 hypothetical protein [Lentibacillus sp. JNUCC-1]
MGHRHQRHCHCRPKQVVYPVKHDCVNCYSESEVEHIHPSHTTVMNHHLVKNKHVYPHSTSVQNTWNEQNVYGGSYEVPGQPNNVAGAMSPPPRPGMGPGQMPGPGNMMPGGPGNQVAGAMTPRPPNHHGQMKPGMGQWQKPNHMC